MQSQVIVPSAREAAALLVELARADESDPELAAYNAGRRLSARGCFDEVRRRVRFVRERVERFASPVKTLLGGYGDCDDSARAMRGLAAVNGHPAELVFFQRGPSWETADRRHVAARVLDGGAWRWAETTLPARYGEHPLVAARRVGIDTRGWQEGPREEDLMGDMALSTDPRLDRGQTLSIQKALDAMGYDVGGEDGIWGPKTAAALRAFQSATGLANDGIPGPLTIAALGVTLPDPGSSSQLPSYVGDGFAAELVRVMSGVVEDPKDALKLLLHESGLEPFAENADGYVGIFQLEAGRVEAVTGMSVGAFKALTATAQLKYAARVWMQNARAFGWSLPLSGRDLYWGNYLPATVVQNAPDAYVFVKDNDTYLWPGHGWTPYAGVFTHNRNLSHGKTYIAAGDMAVALEDGAREHAQLYAAIAKDLPAGPWGVGAKIALGLGLVGAAGALGAGVAYWIG